MYLQEDSPKADEMRKKVRNMLLSDEESNFQLALQLIESGGAHKDFIEPLWIQFIRLHFEYYDKNIKKTVKKFLFSILSDSQREVFEENTKFSRNQTKAAFWDKLLPVLNSNEATNGLMYEFAVCGLILLKAGGKFCLENNIIPKKVLFRLMIQDGILDLQNFGLEEIPEELADLSIKELILTQNPLQKSPSSLLINRRVEHFSFDLEIAPTLIRKFAKCFPNALDKSYNDMAQSLSSRSIDFQLNGKMEDARKTATQGIHFLRPISSNFRDKHYYHLRGRTSNLADRYDIALKCYEHIINSDEEYGDCLYNMACNQSRIGNKFKTLEYIEAHFQYSILEYGYQIYGRDYFFGDNDFETFWNDEDFLLLLDRFVPVVNEQT